MTSSVDTFQLSLAAAEMYEAKFVPALFGEWAPHLVEAAGVSDGQEVLDVACGTGVVARTAAERVGDRGRVVGLDLNEAMLTVARRLSPDLEWQQGDAAQLPFADDSFDVVLCQAALMFFPDVQEALGEMARVTRTARTVAVQVFSSLESQPAYRPFVEAAARHAGPGAAKILSTYWRVGDLDEINTMFDSVGLEVTRTDTRMGTARFNSIEEMVRTEVEATPLVERISDQVYEKIVTDSLQALQGFQAGDGTAEIPLEGHLITARKRERVSGE